MSNPGEWSGDPAQKSDLARKYKFIYHGLGILAEGLIAAKVPEGRKYDYLKAALTGMWDVLALRPTKDWNGMVAQIPVVNGSPMAWSEQGVAKTGTRQQYENARDALVVQALAQHVPRDCDAFLDLGCGWGHRMFDGFRAGIAPNAAYFGGDQVEASAGLVRQVQTLFPAMKVQWFPFNFLDPRFDDVTGSYARVVVFTCHAIEQIARIGSLLFDRILARFPEASISGVHIEPVSFQLASPAADAETAARDEVDRSYAADHGYNLDLVTQLQDHKELEIIAAEKRVLDTGDGNSSSVLVWRRRT